MGGGGGIVHGFRSKIVALIVGGHIFFTGERLPAGVWIE